VRACVRACVSEILSEILLTSRSSNDQEERLAFGAFAKRIIIRDHVNGTRVIKNYPRIFLLGQSYKLRVLKVPSKQTSMARIGQDRSLAKKYETYNSRLARDRENILAVFEKSSRVARVTLPRIGKPGIPRIDANTDANHRT